MKNAEDDEDHNAPGNDRVILAFDDDGLRDER
jgi:hypothetical protein